MNKTSNNIVGNYFNKYQSNHFLYRRLVRNYRLTLHSLIQELQVNNCLEIGSGEGYIVDYLLDIKPDIQIVGSDIEYSMVRHAKLRCLSSDWCVAIGDNLPFGSDTYDLVLACEVMEHVINPINVIRELHRVSRKYVVISVPYEPFWRILNMIRLKYLRNFGNTPGHINHWSKKSIINLVNAYFEPINLRISFPWIFVQAEKKVTNKNV